MLKIGVRSMHFSLKPNGDKISSKAIISNRSSKKSGIKYSRLYKCYYIVADAYLDNIPVRIFYVRSSKRAPWCGILTTDTSLDFLRAYKIYAMRWSIEVIYYDKYYIMQSLSKNISDNVRVMRLLLTTASHKIIIV